MHEYTHPTLVLAVCVDERYDPVAPSVLAALERTIPLTDSQLTFDGRPVLHVQCGARRLEVLRLDKVMSHDYRRYAPLIADAYPHAETIVIVNWHAGSRAPDNIFTIQTTGDMASGTFSPVDPRFTRALFRAVEHERRKIGLDAFSTWMEATHWSGTLFNSQPGDLVRAIAPPVIDLEIGSTPDAWSNQFAAQVLAHAIVALCNEQFTPRAETISLLCLGGIHFEPAFTQLMLEYGESQPIALSHILPNHWLVEHQYDRTERLNDLIACVASIKGGIDIVAFHDNLKGSYKQQAKRLATYLNVPAFSHRKLRMADLRRLIRESREAEAPH